MPEKLTRRWPAQLGLALALAILMAALSIAKPNFLTVANLVNLVRQISINGILAVGVTFVLLTGGVDLSLGSLVALTGVVAACFAHPDQYSVLVAVLAGVAAGTLCGAANGPQPASQHCKATRHGTTQSTAGPAGERRSRGPRADSR